MPQLYRAQNMPERFLNMSEYVLLCLDIFKYACICRNMHEYAQIGGRESLHTLLVFCFFSQNLKRNHVKIRVIALGLG